MNEVMVGIIGLCIVLLLFLTGIELAFAMILIGFLGFGYLISFSAAFNLLAKDVFDVFNSYSFTVIPLFVLMGQVAFNSGIAKRLFDAAYKFIGHVPGGLAIATVAGATAFKSICGSSLPQPQRLQALQCLKWIATIMIRDSLPALWQSWEPLGFSFRQALPL